MKKIKIVNEIYESEKIIKTGTDIIGYDSNGIELFAFRGISDFSGFTLEENQEFDKVEPSQEDILRSKLIKDGMTMQLQQAQQQKVIANLLTQVASLSAQISKLTGGTQ